VNISTGLVELNPAMSTRRPSLFEHIVFGDTLVPEEFTIGMEDPRAEVSVWLQAGDSSWDVTARHTTACTSPLILCAAVDEKWKVAEDSLRRAVLQYRDCAQGKVLGEIRLLLNDIILLGAHRFALFKVRGSSNHCLPRIRLWAHYLRNAHAQLGRNDPPDIRMSPIEQRAAIVTFIRAHPLFLVSVGDRAKGNIFTMNLAGDLGNGYVGFALRNQRIVADLVERARRVAISGLPIQHCPLAFQLAANYKVESIDWAALPFGTVTSTGLGIPVPDFAAGVREVEIVKVERVGGHRFFIARIIHEVRAATGLRACVVHGFYQFWRTKGDRAKLRASVAADSIHKGRSKT
jgi:flavin reductase (DIM6/NTAB) family NADH-FMN oxidoreductase RutF